MEQFNCVKLNICNTLSCPCCWYNHFTYLCNEAEIPENRVFSNALVHTGSEDFDRYNSIKSKIVEFVENHNNLDIQISSNINNLIDYGTKLLLNYFSQISYSCGYENYGMFIDVPWYVDKIKDNISLPDKTIIPLKHKIDNVQLAVFCNMNYNDNKIVSDTMNRHISYIVSNKLSTVFIRPLNSGNPSIDRLVKMINPITLNI